MNVTRIVVTAGRTFNHPHESYSNLRPSVSMEATLEPGEDATQAARELQARAEGLVEDHKQGMLRSIEELYQLTERQAEMTGLQRELERAQRRLDDLRQAHPELKSLPAPAETAPQTARRETPDDLCTQCGCPIDHDEPHTVCESCREKNG